MWVITDEIYEHLTFGEHRFTCRSPPPCPSCSTRCVILNGVAKTYAMTGWRVGWLIGPARRGQGGHQPPVATPPPTSPNVAQAAALAAAAGDRSTPSSRCAPPSSGGPASPHRILSGIEGVTCLEPEGAFYAYPEPHRACSGRPIRGRNGADHRSSWRELLLDEVKVAVVPGEAFGTPGYARLSASPWATTTWARASRRIADAVADG